MMNKILILFCLVLLTGCRNPLNDNLLCLRDVCFEVEIVSSERAITRGLQHRKFLPVNKGMLFVFQRSFTYSFWMKDTLIPLDMIWIDENRRVVYTVSSARLCPTGECPAYTSPHYARYVFEINAGLVKKIGIKEGDIAEFRLNPKMTWIKRAETSQIE